MDTPVIRRCAWADSHPLLRNYHDDEWGTPCHDDRRLFEMLMLEGFQAGLSWLTILRKREGFRRAFDEWDPERIAAYGPEAKARLLADPGIVRNRAKVDAAVQNARAYIRLREEEGSLDAFLWGFVGGQPIRLEPRPRTLGEYPARTPVSDALSKELKRRGFGFVGTTIVYAFMQAVGLADDHSVDCFKAIG